MLLKDFVRTLCSEHDCSYDERRFAVAPGQNRTGARFVRKLGDKVLASQPFFVDDVDEPLPADFIRATCTRLRIDPQLFGVEVRKGRF
jgi:hypothetical protein